MKLAIEELARQAGMSRDGRLYLAYIEDLERFAQLVEAALREVKSA